MAFKFKLPLLNNPLMRNRYEVTDPDTFEQLRHEILVLDEGELKKDPNGNVVDAGKPINIDNLNEFSDYLEDNMAKKLWVEQVLATKETAFSKNTAFNKNFGSLSQTVCEGNDSRLSDSRKCNNTFDNATTAKNNLGLATVSTTGSYNDLNDKPNIESPSFVPVSISNSISFSISGNILLIQNIQRNVTYKLWGSITAKHKTNGNLFGVGNVCLELIRPASGKGIYTQLYSSDLSSIRFTVMTTWDNPEVWIGLDDFYANMNMYTTSLNGWAWTMKLPV